MSMTRQEQLDAVVRNYGSWNAGFNNGVAFWIGSIEDVGYTDSYNIHATNCPAFTRAEVEQRKAELQSKPGWDDAPEGAKILVYSPSRRAWKFASFYNARPVDDTFGSGWVGEGEGSWFDSHVHEGKVIGDWRDTLEKRPEPEVTPEEEEAFKDMENAKLNSGETLEDAINNTVKALGLDAGWDGEGLPPIGEFCEAFDHSKGEWVSGKVLMHGNSDHAFASGSPEKWSKLFWACKFRPIKPRKVCW